MLLPPGGNISNLQKKVLEMLKGTFYVALQIQIRKWLKHIASTACFPK